MVRVATDPAICDFDLITLPWPSYFSVHEQSLYVSTYTHTTQFCDCTSAHGRIISPINIGVHTCTYCHNKLSLADFLSY